MGEDDSGLVAKPRVELLRRAQPGRGIGRLVPAQQRAGKENRLRQFNRLGLEQDVEVGRKLIALALEELLFPQAACAAVIVVAGDGKNGNPDGTDGAARGRNGGLGRAGGIEKIAGKDHEFSVMLPGSFPDALEDGEPLVLEQRALLHVVHAGKGFAELPVGGVKECRAHNLNCARSTLAILSSSDRLLSSGKPGACKNGPRDRFMNSSSVGVES